MYSDVFNRLRRSEQKNMPENLKVFSLAGMSRKERLQAIIQSIDRYYYEFGIHFVVIDGVADLIPSANDEAEGVRLVDELHRLAGIYTTCMIYVLYSLPTRLKLRILLMIILCNWKYMTVMENTISKEYFDESMEKIMRKLSVLEKNMQHQDKDNDNIILSQLFDNQYVCWI